MQRNTKVGDIYALRKIKLYMCKPIVYNVKIIAHNLFDFVLKVLLIADNLLYL